MRCGYWLLLMVAVAVAVLPGSAFAAKRVALIIGNGAYQSAPQLSNPANDAAAMAKLFTAAGFDKVNVVVDGTREAITGALRKFADDSDGSDVSVVFYSGHGIEMGGENYLVPVDAKLATDRDVKYEAVALADVRDAIDGAVKLKLILLDACRDNPFAVQMKRSGSTRSISRGLAPVADGLGANLMVAYAAAPGQLASDGDSENSPFTTALIKELTAPGADIELALRGVRDDVVAATSGKQVPYKTGSIGRESIYLGPLPAAAAPAAPAADADSAARADFALAERVGAISGWDEFLKKYPDGLYAGLARAERAKLAGEPAKADVTAALTPVAPGVKAAPNGSFKDCEDCPEMVVAPAGKALIGSLRGEPGRDDRAEVDPHEVDIARPFAIGRFDVTFAEWDACVADGACRRQGDMGFGRGRRPAIFVSWRDAEAFVQWLKTKTGKSYRLPSEAEWEYAARGCTKLDCDQKPFWFGAITPENAVYDWRFSYQGSPKAYDNGQRTEPVDRGAANPFGLFNMLGNVRQWTLDCWSPAPPAGKSDGSPLMRGDCSERVTRGGSWNEKPAALRAGARAWAQADDRTAPNIGFRVVRDLD